jgi:hypothetical protein
MATNMGNSEREELNEDRIDVYGTNPNAPEEGRIFVGTDMGWFERLEGQSGDIAFTRVGDSEEEVRGLIVRDDAKAELNELGGKYSKKVTEEYEEQTLSDSGSVKDPSEEPGDEEDQEYHQHG